MLLDAFYAAICCCHWWRDRSTTFPMDWRLFSH